MTPDLELPVLSCDWRLCAQESPPEGPYGLSSKTVIFLTDTQELCRGHRHVNNYWYGSPLLVEYGTSRCYEPGTVVAWADLQIKFSEPSTRTRRIEL